MIGPFADYEGNPVLTPATGFEAERVYNPAVIVVAGVPSMNSGHRFWMLYRAEAGDGCTGRIGLAWSEDGIHFDRHPEPVITPEHDYEQRGCEDPRIVRFGDTYWLTYVGNSGGDPDNICLASSKDLFHWEKHGSILQPAKDWDSHQVKAGVIVPERIGGKYVMYFTGEARPWETSVGIAYSDDLLRWYEPLDEPVMKPRTGRFDSKGVETGTNPVLTPQGILMVYSGWGADNAFKAQVLVVEPLGQQNLLTVKFGRDIIKVSTHPTFDTAPNNDIWLRFPADKIRWIDRDSGQVLYPSERA